MARSRADRLKIVARPESVSEVVALRDLLRETSDPRLCAFGTGTAGAISRLLAPAWGSWGSYAAASRGAETGEGQFTVDDLRVVYDVRSAGPETRLVALAGSDILPASPSPAMHNAGYRALGLNRLYVPLQCDRWEEVVALTAALELDGLAVTMPFKGHAAAWVEELDEISCAARAVNTIVLQDGCTRGANTDAPAAIGFLETRGLGPLDDVDILGGGGTARAIAAALVRTGRRPTLWTRSTLSAEHTPAGVPTDRLAARRPGESDWLVNATPLRDASLLGSGPPARRGVLDVVYGGSTTELVRRAEEHGLAAIDGFELLVAQAERQFRLHTGRDAPAGVFAEAGQRYLAGLG
jgi:3-dehydroquinate dehydratase/shikimate dehydrogenase